MRAFLFAACLLTGEALAADAARGDPVEAGRPAASGGVLDSAAKVLERDRQGCTWVEATAGVLFSEDDTRHQAKARAVAEARSSAMQQFLGVNIQHQFMDFQQENLKGEAGLTENLLRVTQLGRIMKERVVAQGLQDMPDCTACRYFVRLRTCILPLEDKLDRNFRVTVTLNRTRLEEGDEAIARIEATRDAYVYLYSVDMDGSASLLFPATPDADNRLKAGERLEFPSAKMRKAGMKMIAQLPSGARVSAETLRVIAATEKLLPKVYDPAQVSADTDVDRDAEVRGGGSLFRVLQGLHASGVAWVEDAQAFTIQR